MCRAELTAAVVCDAGQLGQPWGHAVTRQISDPPCNLSLTNDLAEIE